MAADNTLAILSANLEEIKNAADALHILTEGQIAELSSLCPAGSLPPDNCMEVFGEDVCSVDFARFCRRALRGMTDADTFTRLLTDLTPVSGENTGTLTAYMRNLYSDRAFERFSGGVHRLSARYFSSFSAACEEVYYDRCQYCILPLQTTDDGTLSSFYRMIGKYELKIRHICDIPTQDGEATVRYALLRRGIVPHCPKNGYFEASFILPEEVPLGRFLAACEATGARIDRIRSMPLSYADDIVSLCVTFRITPETAAPLLYFLRSVLHSYTPEGLYCAI